jgi:hypothetical protein
VSDSHIEEMASVLLGAKADHVFADTTTCRCSYKPNDSRDWDWHVAINQAIALIDAGSGGYGKSAIGGDS